MGLFDRLRAVRDSKSAPRPPSPTALRSVTAQLFSGDDDLEIVGEASYQDSLWSICGGAPGDRIRHETVAVLVPEPDNPHDSNAIAVQIDGHVVGYFARELAVEYGPGLQSLMLSGDAYVALRGVIVGGGYYPDGPGRLGVWLEHDPRDFGVSSNRGSNWSGPAGRVVRSGGTMRTGFMEAWLTDVGAVALSGRARAERSARPQLLDLEAQLHTIRAGSLLRTPSEAIRVMPDSRPTQQSRRDEAARAGDSFGPSHRLS